ncbi:uncharacterized protein EI90DRAFT_2188572 [Cantharellus anzutake]|uniref:uncharacterized protein n=1 Tax=Cantharellus anzutake TaxID=1750568 RepID=UPI001908BA64|nr:uncharacterized protein EI90DRAFT_2188572 [Cantharellus anzutake]KAF8325276.1 hypothetical protein EI90DRAFT_2188572 [Cantharellus anzutake]
MEERDYMRLVSGFTTPVSLVSVAHLGFSLTSRTPYLFMALRMLIMSKRSVCISYDLTVFFQAFLSSLCLGTFFLCSRPAGCLGLRAFALTCASASVPLSADHSLCVRLQPFIPELIPFAVPAVTLHLPRLQSCRSRCRCIPWFDFFGRIPLVLSVSLRGCCDLRLGGIPIAFN